MTYTVSGIDISRWQDPATDGSTMDGCEFVGIRACYGTAADSTYAAHELHARQHGAVVIAYLFGRYGDGARQADALLAAAPHADLYLLDLESDGGNPAMTASQASAFLARMHAITPKKTGLYHSESGFPSGLGEQFRWVAKWGSTPPSGPWAFWQWQGSPLDRDWFSGTLDQLKAMAGTPAAAPVQYRVTVSVRTALYDRPGGTVVAHVGDATYTCTKSRPDGTWWYRIVNAGTNRGRYMRANPEPGMVVRPA